MPRQADHAGLRTPVLALPGVEFDDERKDLLEMVRGVVAREIAPEAAAVDREHRFPIHTVEAARAHGLLDMAYPPELGGSGADTAAACMVLETVAASCAASAVTMAGHFTATLAVLLGGDERQRRLLEGSGDGAPLWGVAISEPDAGSDVAAIKTTARRDGDDYVIDGTKRWVTNGGQASAYVVFARTGGDDRRRALSAFIVSADAEGVQPGKPERKMGLRGSATTDLVLEGVRLEGWRRIGPEGGGFDLVATTMARTRSEIAAIALGIAEGALSYAYDYVQERRAFGRPIGDFQATRFRIADLVNEIAAARVLTYYAAHRADLEAADAPLYASMAKRSASDAAMRATTDAVQLLGGNGYVEDYPVERMMRDAKVTQIFEGTNEIQQLVIWSHCAAAGLPFGSSS